MVRILDIVRSLIPDFENLAGMTPASSLGSAWILGALGTISVSLFGLSMGRTRAVISLLSIYVAFVFNLIFPYFGQLNSIFGSSVDQYWFRIVLFLFVYLVVFFIFNSSFIKKRISSREYSLFWIAILALVQLGFMLSIILNILPQALSNEVSFGFYNYFGTQQALFLWALAPLPIVILMGKK